MSSRVSQGHGQFDEVHYKWYLSYQPTGVRTFIPEQPYSLVCAYGYKLNTVSSWVIFQHFHVLRRFRRPDGGNHGAVSWRRWYISGNSCAPSIFHLDVKVCCEFQAIRSSTSKQLRRNLRLFFISCPSSVCHQGCHSTAARWTGFASPLRSSNGGHSNGSFELRLSWHL